MSNPRARICRAAMQCFGAKGFAATSIMDIERASGLTPGAGGTYRHFASKQAILEAAIDEVLSQSDDELAPVPTSLREAACTALTNLDRQRDLMRVLFRDLDQFPELLGRVVDRLLAGPYRVVAERTAKAAPGVDAEAVATLLVGGLTNFKVIEALAGKRRSAVSEKRLIDAWAYLYALVLKEAGPGR